MGGGGGAPDPGPMIASNEKASKRAQEQIDKYYGLEQEFLTKAQDKLEPFVAAGKTAYGAYNQAMGLPDLEGNKVSADTVLSRFQNAPGYQSALKSSLQGLSFAQSATGRTGSGAAMKEAARYASDYGNRGFQGYLGNLGSATGIGAGMALGQTGLIKSQGDAAQAAGINTANNISGTQAQNSQLYAQSMAAQSQQQSGYLGLAGGIAGGIFSLF